MGRIRGFGSTVAQAFRLGSSALWTSHCFLSGWSGSCMAWQRLLGCVYLGRQSGGDSFFFARIQVAEGGIEEDARKRAVAHDENVAVDVDACQQRGDICFQAVSRRFIAERLVLSGLHRGRNAANKAAEIAGGVLDCLLEGILDLVSALKNEVVRATHGCPGSLGIAESRDRGGELLVMWPRERL